MAKNTIAGLDDNAVIIPGAVNFQDADGKWDRSDPETGYVAQEQASSVAKSSGWNNLTGKNVQIVKVENGATTAFPPSRPAGITSPTYQRANWANGMYVYEVPA